MFEDAAALPPGPKKQEMLKLAHVHRSLAGMVIRKTQITD
jgi:hypothetical protein